MPREAFPLSKGHRYYLGSSWRWCVHELEGSDARYRLLVAFDAGKAQYQAWLALRDGRDQALIGRLEYHPTHRGWHCHYKRGPLSDVARGVVKDAGQREGCRGCDGGDPFAITENDGIGVAFRVFCVAQRNESAGLLS